MQQKDHILKPTKDRIAIAVILSILFYSVTTPASYLSFSLAYIESFIPFIRNSGGLPLWLSWLTWILPVINSILVLVLYVVGWYLTYVILTYFICKDLRK